MTESSLCINRREFMKIFTGGVLTSLLHSCSLSDKSQPNFLFIITDANPGSMLVVAAIKQYEHQTLINWRMKV